MRKPADGETARLALSLLDLTNLNDDCDADAITTLCARAEGRFGHVAAVCVWPRFVAHAREELRPDSPVRIATVVNFPGGEDAVSDVIAETVDAIAAGADEIDLVMPYRALIEEDEATARSMILAVRDACPSPLVLKVILETGELGTDERIRSASHLAIGAGADFLKTSTGKVAVNATLEAADIMLNAIRESGRAVGFKAAGGVRSVADAAMYIELAEAIMGREWVGPATFRFGASGLLGDIEAALGQTPAAAGGSNY